MLLCISSLIFLRSQTLGISVFLENVYYTDASSKVIKEVNKYTGGRTVDVNKKQMAKPPVGVKVVHALNQPLEDSNSAFTGFNRTLTLHLYLFLQIIIMVARHCLLIYFPIFFKKVVTLRVETA